MNKNKILIKNTLILGIGQFVPKIISIIILPILTYYLTTSDYGIYDLIISFSNLVIPLFTLMVQQAVFRYLIETDDIKLQSKYITNTYITVFFFSIIWFILSTIYVFIFHGNFSLILIIFLLYFFQSIYDVNCQIVRGFGRNKEYSFSIIVYSISNLILLFLLIFFQCINVLNIVVIMGLSYVISFLYLFFKAKIHKFINYSHINFPCIKKLLNYSIPMIPSSISLWIVNLSDRLIITKFIGSSMNGIYAAANKVPNLFGTAYSIFNLAWTELAARTIKEENSVDYYSKLFHNLYCFLIGTLLVLITLSPILFNLLINNKFVDGYWQMPILFLGVFFSSLVSFYGGIYVALEKTKRVGISSFIGALLNFTINIVCINSIGLYAASISTFISFLIIFLYRYYNLKRYIDIKYNFKEIFIGMFVLSIVIALFYSNKFTTFILSAIIAVVYNLKFNKIILYMFNKIVGW